MSDEKTEQPTDKKLRDARRDGEVSKSTDLIDGVLLAGGALALIAGGNMLVDAARSSLTIALRFVSGEHDMVALAVALQQIGSRLAGAVLVPVAVAFVAVSVALMPQVGFQVSMKPVAFKLSAVSPMAGFKKIFSVHALIDLVKMMVKGLIVSLVMWQTIKNMMPMVVGSLYQPLPQLSRLFAGIVVKLFGVAALVFIIMGAADVKLQKWLFIRGKKMSKDEVKREHKQDEGDPVIKGERRRIARELSTTAPRPKVGSANVMVVNPTHYAVAVRYAPEENPLPVIIAKGFDEEAARLRREAHLADVPIVGNPPLARALYKVELDAPIPEELFETVAAILRWVDSLGAR
ncbi:type III secretion system export apparatus subunit SctU [Caballeronia mineralivorans]|uniref:type III secretion system export apparatus subunit SctU n=1 Tax=Caballeronia mineralivorans TaxID=2010198 RepID=UPI0023EFD830|nr:type III secretion system export apparatus subunit SctU [Caballeronia mineralivorans]MDB5787008.1 EscU/YscU/HrcU family type secretion system export apparatus switch protein [Caballeronia mineralivorans]MEA3098925.1 type secretion protein [Caballeronia mineralivorans]